MPGSTSNANAPIYSPINSTQDPIIGTWHWTLYDRSKTIFYTFTSDGHYSTSDSMNEGTESGTWIKYGKNRYNVTVEGRKTILFVYQPETNTIAMADTLDLHFYPPGKGSAIVTPNPNTPVTLTSISASNELNSQQNGNPYEKNATIALELLHCYHGDDSYSYDDCVTIATRDLPKLGAPVSDVSMVMKDWCKIRTDPRCNSL